MQTANEKSYLKFLYFLKFLKSLHVCNENTKHDLDRFFQKIYTHSTESTQTCAILSCEFSFSLNFFFIY